MKSLYYDCAHLLIRGGVGNYAGLVIKRFQPINPGQKLIRPPICECRAVIFLSSIDFGQFIACIISIDFGQFIARNNISHAGK